MAPIPSSILPPGACALADAVLVGLSWVLVYAWRFGWWPLLSRGPLGVIAAWFLIHYLLGPYTALVRHQLDFGCQVRNCFAAGLGVFALAAAAPLLRGELLSSTVSRGLLLPVLARSFLFGKLLRLK